MARGWGKEGVDWKYVYHFPRWVAAPLRKTREWDTFPGFVCLHEKEDGKGLCGRDSLEMDLDPHAVSVRLRGRWKLSRGCYDKYRRCPGWAGGGWTSGKEDYCWEGGYLQIDYDGKWWKWKTQRCSECDVVVLPYMFRYTSPRALWYEIKYSRNSWLWLMKTEIWVLRKLGRL